MKKSEASNAPVRSPLLLLFMDLWRHGPPAAITVPTLASLNKPLVEAASLLRPLCAISAMSPAASQSTRCRFCSWSVRCPDHGRVDGRKSVRQVVCSIKHTTHVLICYLLSTLPAHFQCNAAHWET